MKTIKNILPILLVPLVFIFLQCQKDQELIQEEVKFESRARKSVEVGNNLSFPVIWSDGVSLPLAGTIGEVVLNGEWWYVWGPEPIDPQSPIYSCEPNPSDPTLCLNATNPGEDNLTKAFLQKDANNVWQAENVMLSGVEVDFIDWGDNLESVSWNTRSQVRTEVVLYKLATMQGYQMRHVSGWGTDEVHGVATNLATGEALTTLSDATVYSANARLTIQKFTIDKNDIPNYTFAWVDGEGWIDEGGGNYLIKEPIINEPYGAEVNVKGKVIYGYTWNVRNDNDGGGVYRVTFSFDNASTSIANAEIIYLSEEEEFTAASAPGVGGSAVLVPEENLTYIDIIIAENNKGKGGKGRR